MRKCTLSLACIVLVFSLALNAFSPRELSAAANDRQELTAEVWQASPLNEKLSFLYGVSCAVVVEKELASSKGEEPSIFVKNWLSTFNGLNAKEIVKKLDSWIAAHPASRNRHIFDVIWYEFIVPGSKSNQGEKS